MHFINCRRLPVNSSPWRRRKLVLTAAKLLTIFNSKFISTWLFQEDRLLTVHAWIRRAVCMTWDDSRWTCCWASNIELGMCRRKQNESYRSYTYWACCGAVIQHSRTTGIPWQPGRHNPYKACVRRYGIHSSNLFGVQVQGSTFLAFRRSASPGITELNDHIV